MDQPNKMKPHTIADCHFPHPDCSWRDWYIPLNCKLATLQQVLDHGAKVMAEPDDIPLIIKLVENPKFDIPGINLFNGAVSLKAHDCIHALLGRGLLMHDEAFTIGFTMGSTNRISTAEQKLYSLAAKYLYPEPYQFNNDDIQIFKDAVHLGYISDCQPLDKIDYNQFLEWPLEEIRETIGLETDLLRSYYRIEAKRYPNCKESQRLL